MLKIAHVKEIKGFDLPREVVEIILDAVKILDDSYGEDRDVDGDDGGYALIIESKEDLDKLKDIQIDIKTSIAEYTDPILCSDGAVYTSTLVLRSSDFGIVVVMPIEYLGYTNWAVYLYNQGNS